jgi:energy-coupling factor transporter ATP-binding protein EcfA2
MITIESLTKRYGRFTAVDDVTFTATPGQVTGFLGPNEAGKSTTMRVMVGLTPPTSGEVTVNGRRYADLPNPGLEVGVLLDASAQHAGLGGRDRGVLRLLAAPADGLRDARRLPGLVQGHPGLGRLQLRPVGAVQRPARQHPVGHLGVSGFISLIAHRAVGVCPVLRSEVK